MDTDLVISTPTASADPSTPRPDYLARAVWVLVLYIFVMPLLFGIIMGFGRGVVDGLHHVHGSTPSALFVQVSTLGGALLACVTCLGYVHRHWRPLWHDGSATGLGFCRVPARQIAIGAALGIAAQALGALLVWGLYHGHPPQQAVKLSLLAMPPALLWLALPMATLLVPWVEETLFRGMLWSALTRRMSRGLAAALVTLLFVAAHLPGVGWHVEALCSIMLLALTTLWMRWRYGSLYPGIASHVAFNACLGVALIAAHH